MPSKLRKALGAVKDQTSISIAKVSNTNGGATNLEVLILKATRHDDLPTEDRYVEEIIQLIVSNKVYAAACSQAIAKRVTKTRNWIVALKSLMLVLRIFQDGDPYFPREVLHAMKRGYKILNLSNFRDDSNSSPWDYTAFVRTFALYLDERLDCFLTGKLQRRVMYNKKPEIKNPRNRRCNNEPIRDMKPAILLDRISYWQKLLDRAIATRPTGPARNNRLVQISFYAVVQESFDLYRDISDGLALLLDSFFHLQYQTCVSAFQACVKATKQFEELGSFYSLCKTIGVGRTSEYPSVQQLSDELIETLQEFLKDQASFPSIVRSPASSPLLLPAPPIKDPSSSSNNCDRRIEYCEQSELSERCSETESDFNSQCTSIEDPIRNGEIVGTSPSRSVREYCYSEQLERRSRVEDFVSSNDIESFYSLATTDQGSSISLDFLGFDDSLQQENYGQNIGHEASKTSDDLANGYKDGCWELVLAETAVTSTQELPPRSSFVDDLLNQTSMTQNHYNPFLQNISIEEIPSIATTSNDLSLFPDNGPYNVAPTFRAETTTAPTFLAHNASETTFAPIFSAQSTNEMVMSKTTFNPRASHTTAFLTQSPNESTSTTPTFFTENGNETIMAPTSMFPTSWAQNSKETYGGSGNEINIAPTFNVENPMEVMVAPTIQANNRKEIARANKVAFSKKPTTTPPTFCIQNQKETMPTFRSHEAIEIGNAPSFSVQNPIGATIIAPTFRAEGHKKMTLTTKNEVDLFAWNGNATFEGGNDPFSTSSNVRNSQFMSNGSAMNEESLLLQQKLWLEHQNKIIAKQSR